MSETNIIELTRDLIVHLKDMGAGEMPFAPEKCGLALDRKSVGEFAGKAESSNPQEEEADKDSLSDWESLESQVRDCSKCILCNTRTRTVFGVGQRNNPCIAFVGEGPGADEDRQGEPFVGKAGQLLTRAINNGLGLRREDVYICNVVKCRPPENRAPLPDEMACCLPYLESQLLLLKPKVIVLLGSTAVKGVLGPDTSGITSLRGRWQMWKGYKVMPTFHPAYILRNPSAKRPFWEDLQSVMKEIGLPLNESK